MTKFRKATLLKQSAASLALASCLFAGVQAEASVGHWEIEVDHSKLYDAPMRITRVAVANPDVADIRVMDNHSILIVGKKSGSTTIFIWTANGMRQEYAVQVRPEGSMGDLIRAQLKAAGIYGVDVITGKTDGSILLKGDLQNQSKKDVAMGIATVIAGKDNVIDQITLADPQQVNLECLVLEVSVNDAKNLGIDWMSNGQGKLGYTPSKWTIDQYGNPYRDPPTYTTTDWTLGTIGTFYAGEGYYRPGGTDNPFTRGWAGRILGHMAPVNMAISALIDSGKARVISRPNVTTLSGKTASIKLGGQIPYPITDKDGNVTVEWKDYGVNLDISPTADENGNVTSEVKASVSDIDWSNAVTGGNSRYPALRNREANATVNIPSGMAMAIGGLFNTSDSKTVSKVPFLGDIPIIGELFKHRQNSKQDYELLIIIRPTLTNEQSPVKMGAGMQQTYDETREADKRRTDVGLNDPKYKTYAELQKEKEEKEAAEKAKAEQQAWQHNAPANSRDTGDNGTNGAVAQGFGYDEPVYDITGEGTQSSQESSSEDPMQQWAKARASVHKTANEK